MKDCTLEFTSMSNTEIILSPPPPTPKKIRSNFHLILVQAKTLKVSNCLLGAQKFYRTVPSAFFFLTKVKVTVPSALPSRHHSFEGFLLRIRPFPQWIYELHTILNHAYMLGKFIQDSIYNIKWYRSHSTICFEDYFSGWRSP